MSELNDPRVYFAAERTLLAWNRTSLALMAFGFVVERANLMMAFIAGAKEEAVQSWLAMVVGLGFIVLGVGVALMSIVQFRYVMATLSSDEIPANAWVKLAPWANSLVAMLGVGLAVSLLLTTDYSF